MLGERDCCFGEAPLLSSGFEGLLTAKEVAGRLMVVRVGLASLRKKMETTARRLRLLLMVEEGKIEGLEVLG